MSIHGFYRIWGVCGTCDEAKFHKFNHIIWNQSDVDIESQIKNKGFLIKEWKI